MENTMEPDGVQCCYGCLSNIEEYSPKPYRLQCEALKDVFQTDQIPLCYLCRRVAQHADSFIQTVQSNQILLQNFHNMLDSALQTIRSQTQPLVKLSPTKLDAIEISVSTENNDVAMPVTYSSTEASVKLEPKEEDGGLLNRLEEEFFDGDNDFEYSYVKEEDDFPLQELLKAEVEIEGSEVNTLKKSLKKRKLKKKHKIKTESKRDIKDFTNIQLVYITKKQCIEERKQMSLNPKYLNAVYKCEDCVKGFIFKTSFDKHMERHDPIMGDYKCDICKQRMDTEEKLLGHKRYHTIRYKCNECDILRISRRTIKDHYAKYHYDGYELHNCPKCTKVFKRQGSLRKHIIYAHKNRTRETCAFCSKTYVSKEVLKRHMLRQHPTEVSTDKVNNRHICPDCGMGFSTPSLLKNHSFKHSITCNFYCVECDKSFKSEAILKNHLKTALAHVKNIDLPLGCEHCDKRFAIKRDLERHMNRIHLNRRPFTCDQCNKAYVNEWSLTEHKRLIHEGYKRPLKFPCPMCDKIFDRNQILKSHIRTHTGERPFQCSKCPATFSQAGILGTHMKLIHLKLTRDGRPKTVSMK